MASHSFTVYLYWAFIEAENIKYAGKFPYPQSPGICTRSCVYLCIVDNSSHAKVIHFYSDVILYKNIPGQPIYKKLEVDSLKLGTLKFDKPLVYRNDSIQFVVESAKFRKNLLEAIQYYEEIRHPEMNNNSSHRKIVRRSIKKLNSAIKTLDNQVTKSDTIFISQITLDWRLHPSTKINWFITKEIDSLTCMIVDSKNVYQNIVIREKSKWTAITGGRRYYFPNENAPFIIFRDWAQ